MLLDEKNVTHDNRLAVALLRAPWVEQCTVLRRTNRYTDQLERVAYVVLNGNFSESRLRQQLAQTLPDDALTDLVFVPISRMPLTATGEVDRDQLIRLSVIDTNLAQQWEKTLRATVTDAEVAVVLRPYTPSTPYLHRSDLLPDGPLVHDSVTSTSPRISEGSVPTTDAVLPSPIAAPERSPALSEGAMGEWGLDLPTHLGAVLVRAAQAFPTHGVTYLQADGTAIAQAYPDLLAQAERLLTGLRQQGLQPQDKVLFQFESHPAFITAFWACVLGGFVPVPIAAAPVYDPNNSVVKKLLNAWQRFAHPLILTQERLRDPIRALGAAVDAELHVAAISDYETCPPSTDHHPSQGDDLALLLLTSGSTGVPKGVALSHHNLIHSVAATAEQCDFSHRDRFLNWLPLDHPGPIIRCVIRPVYLGAQALHAPTAAVLADPLRWFDWIEAHQVTSAWAPNFAFALVNDRAEAIQRRQWDLSCVRSLLNTAEPIVPQTARRFLELMAPHGLAATAMHASWGMAETASGVTFNPNYLVDPPGPYGDTFANLGTPMRGIALRIVDEHGQVVPEGTIGALQVKGASVTAGYYEAPDLNQEAFDAGWFKTGDLGFLDRGQLTITGRSKDVIIINGSNYYAHEIEAVVEAIPGVVVSYTAACATRPAGSDTDQLILFFHTALSAEADRRTLLKAIQTAVVKKLGIVPAALLPVAPDVIPKTSIGKIQRSQLRQQFEAGEFDSLRKQVDLLLGNDNTLPDWFYRPIWRPCRLVEQEPWLPQGHTLLLVDDTWRAIWRDRLQQAGHCCLTVTPGTTFTQWASDHYSLDPHQPDHYAQLITAISAQGITLGQIIHTWTYGSDGDKVASLEHLQQILEMGTYSLLGLVQAISQAQCHTESVKLAVVSSQLQAVNPGDPIAYAHSPMLGLIKTFPRELPWLDSFHVDVPAGLGVGAIEPLLSEMAALPRAREVAYRQGERLIPRLEPADLLHQPTQPLPFQVGGMYVLSGGLGGIGVEIARYLLTHYQAKLLLLGRSPLPPAEIWPQLIAQGGKQAERLQAYQDLQQLGGAIAYAAVDLGDPIALQAVVEQARQDWHSDLRGVIHLAGVAPNRLLLDETLASFAETLYPKVQGTWSLYQLVKDDPDCLFINFSSVISVFAGATVGAYAAANTFLNSFSAYLRQQGFSQSFGFCSSAWDEVGASRGKEGTRAQGFYGMTIDQGLLSLLTALYHNQPQILAGIDGLHPSIAPVVEAASYPTQELAAYIATPTPTDRPAPLTAPLCDRFGTPTLGAIVPLPALPKTETGAIDRDRLAAGRGPTAERVPPRTDIERRLVAIWQRLLGTTSLGVTDNFFELGGNSLIAIQLFGLIEQEFGLALPLATLFEAPTIAQLAPLLTPNLGTAAVDPQETVVLIRPGGHKEPIFLIHDADGETILYLNLARRLDPDRPVYGIRPYGTAEFPILHTRISEMVSHYVAKIRSLQPHGPYFVGGLCAGGAIAFEIACHLQALGEPVPLVALIDAGDFRAPSRSGRIARQRLQRFTQAFQSSPTSADGSAQPSLAAKLTRLATIAPLLGRKIKNLITYEASRTWDNLNNTLKIWLYRYYRDRQLPPPPYLQGISVRTMYRFAAKQHRPGHYQGKLLLFRATQTLWTDHPHIDDTPMSAFTRDPLLGWGTRSTAGVDICDVPGGHSSMLQEPQVQVIADKIQTWLDTPP